MTLDLGRVGIWSRELRYNADRGARAAAAAELEDLGYSAVFIPDAGGDVLGDVAHLLAATRRMPIATGILNIWMHDPAEVARGHAEIMDRFGPRFLLGLGSSHAPLVESAMLGPYARPYSKMVEYLDALDEAPPGPSRSPVPSPRPSPFTVPAAGRMLAALGPRMLALARDRAGAAHPYLVPPAHTALAREALGPGTVLAPEQAVLLDSDPLRGRERARAYVSDYLALPNYVRNLRRLGFAEDDFRGGGSDRLVDALVARGDEQAVARRVREHHDAGADHVCIYVIGGAGETLQLDAWRRLAPALTSL
jgi:probable F420-dependent oxidoreductase